MYSSQLKYTSCKAQNKSKALYSGRVDSMFTPERRGRNAAALPHVAGTCAHARGVSTHLYDGDTTVRSATLRRCGGMPMAACRAYGARTARALYSFGFICLPRPGTRSGIPSGTAAKPAGQARGICHFGDPDLPGPPGPATRPGPRPAAFAGRVITIIVSSSRDNGLHGGRAWQGLARYGGAAAPSSLD